MLFFKLFPGIQRSGPKRHDVAGEAGLGIKTAGDRHAQAYL
jgi:hypothetical protein